MSTEAEKDYLWSHFEFNAEQRLKAFNFFVVLAAFADGGVFAAVEKKMSSPVFLLVGGFIGILAIVFWLIDERSKYLIGLTEPGLKAYELQLPEHSQLFRIDAESGPRVARFTTAFRILFALQLVFGIGVCVYSVVTWGKT